MCNLMLFTANCTDAKWQVERATPRNGREGEDAGQNKQYDAQVATNNLQIEKHCNND